MQCRTKRTHESHQEEDGGEGGGYSKNEKSEDVNLGEYNRIKYTEGEIPSCRAYRIRLNNAWMWAGMAVEHTQGLK